MKRSVFRVNYYIGGNSVTAYVCAQSEGEAAAFLGVRDGSAQVSTVASPVEVVGVDTAHPAQIPPPPFVAPPQPPRQFTDAELIALRKLLAEQ
jgi:hypothetical protein